MKEGDFAATIFGFRGAPSYLSSYEVRHIIGAPGPRAYACARPASALMRSGHAVPNDRTRIQYAAKQSRSATPAQEAIGELWGLEGTGRLGPETGTGAENTNAGPTAPGYRFQEVLADLEAHPAGGRTVFRCPRPVRVEFVHYGPEVLRFAERFLAGGRGLGAGWRGRQADAELEKLRKGAQAHFKDYDRDGPSRVLRRSFRFSIEAIAPSWRLSS